MQQRVWYTLHYMQQGNKKAQFKALSYHKEILSSFQKW